VSMTRVLSWFLHDGTLQSSMKVLPSRATVVRRETYFFSEGISGAGVGRVLPSSIMHWSSRSRRSGACPRKPWESEELSVFHVEYEVSVSWNKRREELHDIFHSRPFLFCFFLRIFVIIGRSRWATSNRTWPYSSICFQTFDSEVKSSSIKMTSVLAECLPTGNVWNACLADFRSQSHFTKRTMKMISSWDLDRRSQEMHLEAFSILRQGFRGLFHSRSCLSLLGFDKPPLTYFTASI
jgi:hypothetical protein